MSVGIHDLKFSFNDGYATSSLTIESKEDNTSKEKETPKPTEIKKENIKPTDKSKTIKISVLFLGVVAIVTTLIIIIRKNKNTSMNNISNNSSETSDESTFKNE